MITAVAPSRIEFETPTDMADLMKARAGRARFLLVPERDYLVIDGAGAPGEERFREAMGALYPVAYTLHFALKRRGVTASVGALEGLYWFGDVPGPITAADFERRSPAEWRWRLLLPLPEAATTEEVQGAIREVAARKSPPALPLLRQERWAEGKAAQTLHVGPYASEPPTIAMLHEAIAGAGYQPSGCHHEIYLGDPNRSAPERLKTIIRQPVEIAQ